MNHGTEQQDLDDGLLLRWGRAEDIEAVSAFNVKWHSDDEDNPEEWLATWTRELMNGSHPTTSATDFTLVVDTKADNKVVSTCCLISQTWTYAGVPFGCGRPELIATDPAYRRRSLVRQQMNMLHAKSEARGELVQAITGIPWFYRQFGYEMTLELSGSRAFQWGALGQSWLTSEAKKFRLRPATVSDIPTLQTLYTKHYAAGLVKTVREAAIWHFSGFAANRQSPEGLHLFVIETAAGETAAYVEFQQWGHWFVVHELAVYPQFALRDIGMFLLNWFKEEAERRNKERKQPITYVNFGFGSVHPLYEAIDSYLGELRRPYAFYVRVPDVAAFLQHIAPVLEERLAQSSLRGFEGKLRLNFYRQQLALTFEAGKIKAVSPYTAEDYHDADALFPELTFYHLLFGHRTLEEIRTIWPDCYTLNSQAAVLLNILFPKRPSWIRPLG
ncbi:MAG: GNAT family N-acetyltransferase [Chloroflexota bacterium]